MYACICIYLYTTSLGVFIEKGVRGLRIGGGDYSEVTARGRHKWGLKQDKCDQKWRQSSSQEGFANRDSARVALLQGCLKQRTFKSKPW